MLKDGCRLREPVTDFIILLSVFLSGGLSITTAVKDKDESNIVEQSEYESYTNNIYRQVQKTT